MHPTSMSSKTVSFRWSPSVPQPLRRGIVFLCSRYLPPHQRCHFPHQPPKSVFPLRHVMLWPGISAQIIHLLSQLSVTSCPWQPSCTILTYTSNISPHKRHRRHLYLFPNETSLHCVGPSASLWTSSGCLFAIASMHSRVAVTIGCPATSSRSSLRPTSIAACFLHQPSQKIREQSDNGTGDGMHIQMADAPHKRQKSQEAESAFAVPERT